MSAEIPHSTQTAAREAVQSTMKSGGGRPACRSVANAVLAAVTDTRLGDDRLVPLRFITERLCESFPDEIRNVIQELNQGPPRGPEES